MRTSQQSVSQTKMTSTYLLCDQLRNNALEHLEFNLDLLEKKVKDADF